MDRGTSVSASIELNKCQSDMLITYLRPITRVGLHDRDCTASKVFKMPMKSHFDILTCPCPCLTLQLGSERANHDLEALIARGGGAPVCLNRSSLSNTCNAFTPMSSRDEPLPSSLFCLSPSFRECLSLLFLESSQPTYPLI